MALLSRIYLIAVFQKHAFYFAMVNNIDNI